MLALLILRRKLLQRPEIVYQNDKMELSSVAFLERFERQAAGRVREIATEPM